MSSSSHRIPDDVALHWVANEVKRCLAKLPGRALEYCGQRFVLQLSTSEYMTHNQKRNIADLFVAVPQSSDRTTLLEFEHSGIVIYARVPVQTGYPVAIDGGIVLDENTAVTFEQGKIIHVYKRPTQLTLAVVEDGEISTEVAEIA